MPDSLYVADDWRPILAAAGLTRLDDLFAWSDGDRLDKAGLESWRQRWRLRLPGVKGRSPTVFLKRFDHPPLRRQWDRWRLGAWGLSTAGVEWRNAEALAWAGIKAAEAVAFGEDMFGPIERRSCVLLGEAAGESLEKWVPRNVPPARQEPDPRRRRDLLNGLARFVARFHAAGFVHRDLYLCHVFIDTAAAETSDAPAGEQAFCLIDLQRVFRPRWRGRRWVVKDLAALDFSTPADRVGRWERLRFLCRYARHCGGFGSARTLAALVAARNARLSRRVRRPTAP